MKKEAMVLVFSSELGKKKKIRTDFFAKHFRGTASADTLLFMKINIYLFHTIDFQRKIPMILNKF